MGNSCIVKAESTTTENLIYNYDLPNPTNHWQLSGFTKGDGLDQNPFSVMGIDCGLILDMVVKSYGEDNEIANSGGWITYQSECTDVDYDIRDAPMACYGTQYWEGINPFIKIASVVASNDMLLSAQRVYEEWNEAYDNSMSQRDFLPYFNLLWPLLYQQVKVKDNDGNLVDNPYAKAYIDKYLTENHELATPNIIDILNTNYLDDVQQQFGFMNQSADCQSYTRIGYFFNNSYTLYPYQQINDLTQNDKEINVCDGTPWNQTKETYETTLERLNWQDEAGFHMVIDPRTNFLRDPGFIGNPYWTEKDRKIAIMKSFGVTPDNPADPNEGGAGQRNPWNDSVGYGGKLPMLETAFNPGNPPFNNLPEKGGGFGTYTDVCEAAGPIEMLLPPTAAFAGFVIPYLILPKEAPSSYVLSFTFAYSFYYIGLDSYGFAAQARALRGVEYYNLKAANVLSAGLGAGGVLALFDIGISNDLGLPNDLKWILCVPVGLASNWFLEKPILEGLALGTGIMAVVTFPLAVITKMLMSILTGCVVNIFRSPPDCECSTAEKVSGGKTDIASTLLQYYGVTGEQYTMRSVCMAEEMARGWWESDEQQFPNMIGSCDAATNTMSNIGACYSAGQWTIGPPNNIGGMTYRPYPANEMWGYDVTLTPGDAPVYTGGIWHCLDAKNPSFIPPQNSKDSICEKQYGKGFRWVDKNSGIYADPKYPEGICKNFQLPGPNMVDDKGLQYPGQVIPPTDGSGGAFNSDCTIL